MFYTRRTFLDLCAISMFVGILTGASVYVTFVAWVGGAAAYLASVSGFVAALIYAVIAGDGVLSTFRDNAPRRAERDADTTPRVYEKIATRLELWDDQFNAKIVSLPAPLDTVSKWLHAVYNTPGYNTAFSLWAGPGKLFGEREYRKVIAELMRRELMRWRDPANHLAGSEWTPAGRVMLRTYALTTAPTENVDDIWDSVNV